MSRQKKIILLPALIISIFGSLLFSVGIAEAAEETTGSSIIMPNLQVAISGFGGFQENIDCQALSTKSNGLVDELCHFPWIGQYIKAIFQYGITAAVILTVIMIMVGGFLWLTAGGTPDRVSKGKDFITSALVGMFLALFSYLLLYTINPNLVNLKPVDVQRVRQIDLPKTTTGSHPAGQDQAYCIKNCSSCIAPDGTTGCVIRQSAGVDWCVKFIGYEYQNCSPPK